MRTFALSHNRHLVTLVAVIAGIAISIVPSARAEVVQTTLRAKLHARPAESSRVLTRVARGKRLKVLRRRGRWMRVRAKGHVGWITRTSSRPIGKKAAKTARKRWIRKADGWEKRVKAKRVSTAAKRQTTAENVEQEPPAVAAKTLEPRAPRGPLPRLALHVRGSLGYSSLGMAFSSNGQQGLGNYDIASSAMTTALAFAVRARPTRRSVVEISADYRLSVASPGIRYHSASTGVVGDIAYTTHEVGARVSAGARASDAAGGIETTARLGYTYSAFITDTNNVGMLPSESLAGLTVGAELAAPRASDTLSISASVDLLAAGTRNQTSGLGDGDSSDASAWWATLAATRRLSANYQLGATYRYQHSRTTWTGQSTRQSDVSSADRVDVGHMFLLGASKSF